MRRRVFSFSLALITAVNMFFVVGVKAEKNEKSYKIEFLELLGVTEHMDDSSYRANVSREDFAYYIANANNFNTNYEPKNRKYIDVSVDSYAFTHIDILYENNIISESSDGTFRPKDSITYGEALTMILNSLGYRELARAEGAWPIGYLSVASNLRLHTSSVWDNITYVEAMELIYDALQRSVYEVNTIKGSADVGYVQSDNTWLFKAFSIEYREGTVEAINGATLFTDALMDKKQILISGEVYSVSENFNEKDFIGSFVKYFYNENEEVVFICREKVKLEDYVADVESFYSYGNNEMVVYSDTNSGKTKRLALEREHIIVYNGMPLSTKVEDTMSALAEGKGTIKFKDSDNDGTYDVVIIENFRNFYISSCDTFNLRIYNKLVENDMIDLKDKEYYEILLGDKTLSLEEISINSVLSIAESINGEMVKIVVGETVLDGKLSELGNEFVKIDRKEYKIENSFNHEFKDRVSIGTTYRFYLDHLGNIAYVGDVDTRRMTYGYLVRTAYVDGLDGVAKFKIFTENNEMVILDAAKQVKIDGDFYKDHKKIKEYFDDPYNGSNAKPQLIEFELNAKGEIIDIDTALIQNSNEDEDYSLYPVYDAGESHWYQSGRFGLKALFGSNTVTFYVPEDASDNVKYYRVGTHSSYFVYNEAIKAAEIYSRSKNSGFIDVMIAKENPQKVNDSADAIMLLESISQVVNEEDEVVAEVGGYYNGNYITAQVSREKVPANMKKGDLIALYKNRAGEAVKVDIVYDCSAGEVPGNFIDNGKGSLLYQQGATYGGETYYRSGSQISFGYALKKFNGGTVISWSPVKGGKETERASIGSLKVSIYDSKSDTIYVGDYSEIIDYAQDSNNPSRVFFHTYLGVARSIFIYK